MVRRRENRIKNVVGGSIASVVEQVSSVVSGGGGGVVVCYTQARSKTDNR